MSTRCSISFYTTYEDAKDSVQLDAKLYKHWDGYPVNVIPLFREFRETMEEKFTNAGSLTHLFNAGHELAAQFIRMFKPEFGDLHPITEEPDDVNFRYELYTTYVSSFNSNPIKVPWRLKIIGPHMADDILLASQEKT